MENESKIDRLTKIICNAYDAAKGHENNNLYFYGYSKLEKNKLDFGSDKCMWDAISHEEYKFIIDNFYIIKNKDGGRTEFVLRSNENKFYLERLEEVKMKNVNAIVMNYSEFDEVVGRVSNGEAGIGTESGEWFYVSTESYNADDIENDLSDYLHVKVESVIIDLSKMKNNVVIICG